jgi:hypothetical protein
MISFRMFFAISAVILISIVGCTPAENFFTKPSISIDVQTIKVGQTATITITAPTKAVTGGNLNLTFKDTGFIYSPKINQLPNDPPAPYLPNSGTGIVIGSEPNFFPIDSDLEVILPLTGSDNVPQRVATVRVNDQSKVTFMIKGKTVGTAVLRGAFLTSSVEHPDIFDRLPVYPEFDGEITIQVVP